MQEQKLDELAVQVEEIKIDVPWGHVSGKWWGRKDIRPVVCVHGWQNNAGSFDRLIPLLPCHLSYLAFDLPGHGYSSWLPDGVVYHTSDFPYILLLIMKHYQWKNISLIGHSMGGICVFDFTSLFNETVDFAVSIDALKPHYRAPHKVAKSKRNRLSAHLIADERNRSDSEPPSYTYEELVDKFYMGSFYSVNRECCKYILERNIRISSMDPHKFYFARDSRLKCYNYGFVSQDQSLAQAERVKCPYLLIKATSSSYFENKEYFDECVEIMQKNPCFEFFQVEGTHHVHLNEPERVSDIISDFINKYRSAEHLSKL